MSSSLLERTRSLHEDLEVLEKAMAKEVGDPSTRKLGRQDQIARNQARDSERGRNQETPGARSPRAPALTSRARDASQAVATLLGAHTARSAEVAELYVDGDGARKEEIANISGSSVFLNFYERLEAVRALHERFPQEPSMESSESTLLAAVLEGAPDEGFTGEETEGRYVDMHALHEAYLNLKGAERVDYCTYLKTCADLSALPTTTATTHAYARYVSRLLAYWTSFLRRTQPLLPFESMLARAEKEFEERWERGEVRRWQSGPPSEAPPADAPPLDLAPYESAAALEAAGLEPLKAELLRLGLKCGGSLKQRAERLFLTKTTPLDQMPKQHKAKPAAKPAGEEAGAEADEAAAVDGGNGGRGGGGGGSGARGTALLEERVSRLGELMDDTLEETAAMVEKKQASAARGGQPARPSRHLPTLTPQPSRSGASPPP